MYSLYLLSPCDGIKDSMCCVLSPLPCNVCHTNGYIRDAKRLMLTFGNLRNLDINRSLGCLFSWICSMLSLTS